jgi:HPr kinase/phosphorylase
VKRGGSARVSPFACPPAVSMAELDTVHASCVVVGEAGVLIRGAPGTGKSTLAWNLTERARLGGRFAALVSDDRTQLRNRHGRLIASPVPAIAGYIEARGAGIVTVVHEPGVVVRLVVDLAAAAPARMPEPADSAAHICGVMLPRLQGRRGASLESLVFRRLSGVDDTVVTL